MEAGSVGKLENAELVFYERLHSLALIYSEKKKEPENSPPPKPTKAHQKPNLENVLYI